MGHTRKLPPTRRAPRGRFQTRWVDPAGRERAKTFMRKVDAERWLVRVESDKQRGTYVDDRAGRRKLADVWAEWRQGAPLAPSTLALYESTWSTYIEPELGSYPVGRITRATVRRLLAGIQKAGASAWVAQTVLRVLRRVLQEAIDAEIIARNPASRVKLPAGERRSRTVLTPAEIDRLAAALPPPWVAFVYVTSYAALRFSEAAALRLDRIDWFRRRIRVDSKIVEVGGRPIEGTPKTAAGYRTVAVPEFVIRSLAEHVRRWPPGPSGLVFHDRNGNPIRRSTFYRAWRPATVAAGLAGFHVRNLRHTGASLAVAAGADLHHLKTRMGHSSIATTSRFYLELYDGQDREIADRLEQLAKDPETERRLRGTDS